MAIGTGAAILGAAGLSAGVGLLGASKGASAQKSAARTSADAQAYATDRQLELQRENRDIAIPEYRRALNVANTESNSAQNQVNSLAAAVRDQQVNQFSDAERITGAYFSPYASAGQAAVNKLSAGDFTESPAYQFRLQEGLDAVEASAAARGGLFSGATGQALQTRGQGEASQEYDNWFARNMGLAGMGMSASGAISSAANSRAAGVAGAYGDYGSVAGSNIWRGADNRSRAQFGMVDGITGIGSNFANASGNALAGYAQGVGNSAANSANATAAQWAGISNAVSGGINNYLGYKMFQDLSAPQAAAAAQPHYLQTPAGREALLSGI